MLVRSFESGRSLLARLDRRADIIDQITTLAKEMNIRAANISLIGALGSAEISYYDQTSKKYEKIQIDEPVELAACSGNISILDAQPFVHVHAVLSSQNGRIWAGHLSKGRIFAAELYVKELLGPDLVRVPDPVTGLNLWGE